MGKQYILGVMLRFSKHGGQAFTRHTSTGLSVTPFFYSIFKNNHSKFKQFLKLNRSKGIHICVGEFNLIQWDTRTKILKKYIK